MEVSVEQTSELGRKMTVTLSESVVQSKVTPRLQKIAKEARIDGFRRGKIPQSVVVKMYGEQTRHEAIQELIQSSYFDALKDNDINPAGYPHINVVESETGICYHADFEVYPIVSLKALDSINVTQQVATVQENDLEQMIEKLKEQRKTWDAATRSSELKDQITISFSGIAEGENFTNGKTEHIQVEIGSGKMIPGFEEHLLGLNVGDTKVFSVSFPEDYPNEKLATKLATFDIEVEKLEAPVLPEINEEFIKAYGTEAGTVESFKNDVKENMERELKNKLKANLHHSVLNALYEKVALTLPVAIVNEEIETLLVPYRDMAKKNKIDFNVLRNRLPNDQLEAEARKRVALGFLVGAIIHENELKIDEAKVRTHVEEMAQSYEKPEQVIEWYYQDDNRLKDVKQMTLEAQVIEWLLTKAIISSEQVDFNTVMNA